MHDPNDWGPGSPRPSLRIPRHHHTNPTELASLQSHPSPQARAPPGAIRLTVRRSWDFPGTADRSPPQTAARRQLPSHSRAAAARSPGFLRVGSSRSMRSEPMSEQIRIGPARAQWQRRAKRWTQSILQPRKPSRSHRRRCARSEEAGVRSRYIALEWTELQFLDFEFFC